MELSTLILTAALFGQFPPPAATQPPTSSTQAVESSDTPLDSSADSERTRNEARALEVLAEAFSPHAASRTTGRPITLLEAISSAADRRQRIDVTHAYWNLSAAEAQHRYSIRELEYLNQWRARAASSSRSQQLLLDTAIAAATARQHESLAALAEAQHALAEQLAPLASDVAPTPTDPPHVGPYATRFNELFGASPAPPVLALLDRALPLRRQLLEARAAAVMAAADALDAAEQATDVATRMDCFEELVRQRRAFISAVRDYNHDIAAYALNIANDGLSRETMVSMLIKIDRSRSMAPTNQPARPASAFGAPREGVVPANYEEEIKGNERDELQFSSPRTEQPPAESPEPEVKFLSPSDRSIENDGAWLPSESRPYVTRRENGDGAAADPNRRRYAALESFTDARRAQELTLLLNQTTPPEAAARVSVADCLATTPSENRRALLAAYWEACESAAREQSLRREVEQLSSLEPLAINARTSPGGPEAMLRLHMAQTAAEADLTAAELQSLLDRRRLAQLVGLGQSTQDMHPITMPHSGGYRMKLEAQPVAVRRSSEVQRLARDIPTIAKAIESRSKAVVLLDGARAQTVAAHAEGKATIDEAIRAIRREQAEISAFLANVTRYNQGIAEYVLAVLPPDTPTPTILSALVLPQATRS